MNGINTRVMETFYTTVVIWLMHAGIATTLSAPIFFFGRKRVHWQWWELSAFVLPFAIWLLFMSSEFSTKKSLANLMEPFYFSLAIPLAALLRVAVGTRISERFCAGVLIAVLCAVAAVVFLVVPSLPE